MINSGGAERFIGVSLPKLATALFVRKVRSDRRKSGQMGRARPTRHFEKEPSSHCSIYPRLLIFLGTEAKDGEETKVLP